MYKLPVELTLKELNAHKELDRLALVRPKKEPEISVIPVSNHVVSLERPDPHDLTMRDLDYINRLDKISRNSIEGATGRILKSGIYPKITPEMREKYLLEEQKNQRDYYEALQKDDPALFARIPDFRVQLEDVDLGALRYTRSVEEIQDDITEYLEGLKEVEEKKQQILTTKDPSLLKEELIILDPIMRKYPSHALYEQMLKKEADLREAEKHHRIKEELAQLQDALNLKLSNLYSELENRNQLQTDYEAERRRVDRTNQQKLQLFEEEFKTLNRGKFSIQREPNETDEEYLQRMEDVGNITIDEAGLNADIARETKNVFKSHLREFIRDNSVIEAIFRELEDHYGEGDAPLVYDKLTQLFPIFKQKTIDILGENPTYGTVSVIVDLIENLYSNGKIGDILVDDEDQKKNYKKNTASEYLDEEIPQADARIVKKLPQDALILNYYNNSDPDKLEADEVNDITEVKKRVKARAVGRTKGITWEEYKKKALAHTPAATQPKSKKTKDSQVIQQPGVLTRQQSKEKEKKDITTFFEKQGKGLKSGADKFSDYCEIGEIMVMPKKLFYKNTLSIRSLKGNAFTGIKDCQVSDNLAKIILELCKGKVPAHQEIKHLSSSEKRIFDELVYMAKLHKEVSHSGEETIQQLKHRLSILEGEIQAGNNNPDILREIHKIVNVLSRMGAVSHNNAREYLQETVGGLIKPRRKSKTIGGAPPVKPR